MSTVDLLEHARTALDRARADLEDIRRDLETHASSMGWQHGRVIEAGAHDLDERLSVLADCYNDMANAEAGRLPALWRHFFMAYDDFLAAVRSAKVALAGEDYIDDLGVLAPIAGTDGSTPGG